MFILIRSILHKQVIFEITRIMISHINIFTDDVMIHKCLVNNIEILYSKNVP